jgi:hypothetical protein
VPIIYRRIVETLIIIAGILLIAITTIAQTSPSSSQDSSSLEDTLKWIQSKVSSYSYMKDKNTGDIDKTEDITYSGCKMDLALSTRHNSETGNIFKAVTKYSFSLKDAERADVFTNKKGELKVALAFKLKIRGTTEYYIGSELQEKEENRDEVIFLPFDDKEMAKRVAKAFRNAIKLCGGGKVKEVF